MVSSVQVYLLHTERKDKERDKNGAVIVERGKRAGNETTEKIFAASSNTIPLPCQ
jgi:hypothetical protein